MLPLVCYMYHTKVLAVSHLLFGFRIMGAAASSVDNQRLCFPSIFLPTSDLWSTFERVEFNLDINKDNSLLADVQWVGRARTILQYIKGQQKWGEDDDVLGKFQGIFVKEQVNDRNLSKEGIDSTLTRRFQDYVFFPRRGQFERCLSVLLKKNPFFTAALAKKDGGFAIDSTCESNSWFYQIVKTFDKTYGRFNCVVNSDFTIGDVDAFKWDGAAWVDNNNMESPSVITPREFKIINLIFMMTFFAEVIHATLHVYHYCMAAAIEDSTRHSSPMKEWAGSYVRNVPNKYTQVKALLFNKGGALTGSVFRSDYEPLIEVCTEMFCFWGSLSTADQFINGFLLAGMGDAAPANTLFQFKREASDADGLASGLVAAFTKQNANDVQVANHSLQQFFTELRKEDGTPAFTSHTTTASSALASWIEMMTVTGVMHAGTYSFSRLLMSQPVLAIMRPENDTFGDTEIGAVALISGTIIGIKDERAVYANDGALNGIFCDYEGNDVLEKYAKIAAKRRLDYWNAIKDRPDFKEIGWILTDYCDDQIDNKQVTRVTYV